MCRRGCGFVILCVSLGFAFAEETEIGTYKLQVEPLYEEDFATEAKDWKVEGRGKVWVQDGRLQMDALQVESTAWFPGELEGDLLITYEARILEPADGNNINLFFLATASDGTDILGLELSGAYREYHEHPNYIMTFTGGYTRLRRNPGFHLVSENREVKAIANQLYKLAVMIRGQEIRCFINGVPVHFYRDETPHRRGKLAFRSWHTRLWWDNLKISRIIEEGR